MWTRQLANIRGNECRSKSSFDYDGRHSIWCAVAGYMKSGQDAKGLSTLFKRLSFIPKGFNRVEVRSFLGRVPSEEYPRNRTYGK